ncbi:MAG: cyclic nucleotide-binding domain-containing protein [Candidatus Omnitrophota bacterium]|nr:cyclic nucleotide-binding domain-containing protein [Candidatus Omnitrophota bacterium]
MVESMRPHDKVAMLKRVSVFASCTEEQLHLIADRTRLVEYKKGEVIYREGDPADAFYIISSGRLRVFAQSNGQEKTFTFLHNGDSFGEVSLLTGETHSATVQALNDTLVLQLQKKDFDDVINRIPSLVLHLSRLLSKRLRTRDRAGEFSEATIVAVSSATEGVGRTRFAVALAAMLKRETRREVVVVDLSGGAGDDQPLYGSATPLQQERCLPSDLLLSERAVEAAVLSHPLGFSLLYAGSLLAESEGEHTIAPLFSFLTKRFHYILINLPVQPGPSTFKALTQSDLIYLVTDASRESLIRTNALIHQLQSFMGTIEQRIKIILNRRGTPGEPAPALLDITTQLGSPVAFTLPVASGGALTLEELTQLLDQHTAPYTVTVRRVARELGGLLVGLALGSGAALGLAHIGVLKVIEREQIPIDLVAGSSIGALIGGLWASGHSADDLERMALRFKNPWDIRRLFIFDVGIPTFSVIIGLAAGIVMGWLSGFWSGLFFGFIVCVGLGLILGPLAGGPIQGARLKAMLDRDFGGKTFDDTWLPLKIVAANPMAREEVVFDSGPLVDAVRASVSIPGIFKPVTRFGKVCLDGGVVSPIPINVLKRAGTHRVIAVNVFPTTPELMEHRKELLRRRAERDVQLASQRLLVRLLWRTRQELIRSISPLVFDVIMRSMQSMEYQIAEVACREADITLRPTVPGAHWLEFFHPEKFIRRGEEITLQYLPELKRIAYGRIVDNP